MSACRTLQEQHSRNPVWGMQAVGTLHCRARTLQTCPPATVPYMLTHPATTTPPMQLPHRRLHILQACACQPTHLLNSAFQLLPHSLNAAACAAAVAQVPDRCRTPNSLVPPPLDCAPPNDEMPVPPEPGALDGGGRKLLWTHRPVNVKVYYVSWVSNTPGALQCTMNEGVAARGLAQHPPAPVDTMHAMSHPTLCRSKVAVGAT